MEKTRGELIHEQVLILAEAYGLPISEARQQIYVDALNDMDPEKVKQGIGHIIKTRTFAGNLPSVAEIREAIMGEGQPLETRAAIAWDKLMYGIQQHCPYDSVQFDDPIIYHIVRAWGGWTEMGVWPKEENKWRRKDFIQLYGAYVAGEVPEPEHHLIGLSEGMNRDTYPDFVPQPVLITGETGRFKSLPYQEPEQKRLSG